MENFELEAKMEEIERYLETVRGEQGVLDALEVLEAARESGYLPFAVVENYRKKIKTRA